MPSVLRRYDDADAPNMSGNLAGSLITVLKAVLVNGYGTTPGLGWSIAFEDAFSNTCVFRPGGNSPARPYVQVKDNVVSPGVQRAVVTAYESMSDVNNGLFPCPDRSDRNTLFKCSTNNATNIPWVIIGDELGFWFLTRPMDLDGTATNDGSLYFPHYIGYWDSLSPGNDYNFTTILQGESNTCYFLDNQPSFFYTMRNPVTQEPGSISYYVGWHYSDGHGAIGYNNGWGSPINGRYLYYPVMMMGNSGGDPTLGTIPGVLNQIWKRANGSNMNAAEREEFYDAFDNYRIFCFAVKNGSQPYNGVVMRMCIIIGEGFRNAY